jgi:hypothetical protein
MVGLRDTAGRPLAQRGLNLVRGQVPRPAKVIANLTRVP